MSEEQVSNDKRLDSKDAEKRARRQKELDESPPELRPLREKLINARDAAVDAITWRNWLRHGIAEHRKWLEDWPLDKRCPQVGQKLADLERQLLEADPEVDRLKVEVREMEITLINAYTEWRIRDVPQDRRDEARALLREEREQLSAVDARIDPGEMGATAGIVFGLEFRTKKAQEAGDEGLVAEYEAKLVTARARSAELQPVIDQRKQAQVEIAKEYERRLLAMIDDSSKAVFKRSGSE